MMVNLFSKLFQQIKAEVVAKVIQGGELNLKKELIYLIQKYHFQQ
jgi:hypothetical protein